MSDAVIFDNVSIVFGKQPAAALPAMDAGQTRGEIQAETGQVLGVHNCNLTVAQGENCASTARFSLGPASKAQVKAVLG